MATPEAIEAVLRRDKSGVIVFLDEQWDEVAPRFAGLMQPHWMKMGSKTLVWVEFPVVPVPPAKLPAELSAVK